MNQAKKNYRYIIYMCMLLLIGVVFFFLVGERGYILEKDSGVFLNSEKNLSYQYIVYPFFLKMCQSIFGKENFLEWVSLIQCGFSLIVSMITTEYVRKTYQFCYFIGLVIFVCTFGPYAYSLPQHVSCHSIMTEGLAFPLFYLWMLCALDIYLNKRNISFIPLLIMTVIMLFTRTQLLLFVVVYILLILERILNYVLNKISSKQKVICQWFLVGILGFLILLGSKIFIFMVGNNVLPQMTDAVAGRVFCIVEENDANLFQGEYRELFLNIYEEIEELKSRKFYFRENIRQWEDVANATNENTKMLVSVIRSFYEEHPQILVNDVKGEMASVLLMEHWGDYLYMTLVLFIQSLVVSIFVHPEFAYLLGYIVAIIMYAVVCMMVVLCEKRYQVESKYLYPMKLTMFVIVCISGITNILFMGLQRYVVYAFGFFYISLIVMGYGLSCKKNRG